ncbi:hypothetical protein [Candidatus Odyssella thessalonicensis]|uniref:hypothetical protein n=1 Tax=Candidatus Odyssella thessalonicensis TaxID=84647 RepID=UPI000225B1F4|nr:hypothetical protein [Candidatus Odyssella thessalonicensis]
MAGFKSPEEMIDKTDYQMPWKEVANTLREMGPRIVKTGTSEEIIEIPALIKGTQLTMLTNESLLYDKDRNIVGILGHH